MGDTNGGTVEIRAQPVLPGYVLFAVNGQARPEQLPGLVSQSVTRGCQEGPQVRVRTALPVVQDGQLAAVHLWYDA